MKYIHETELYINQEINIWIKKKRNKIFIVEIRYIKAFYMGCWEFKSAL